MRSCALAGRAGASDATASIRIIDLFLVAPIGSLSAAHGRIYCPRFCGSPSSAGRTAPSRRTHRIWVLGTQLRTRSQRSPGRSADGRLRSQRRTAGPGASALSRDRDLRDRRGRARRRPRRCGRHRHARIHAPAAGASVARERPPRAGRKADGPGRRRLRRAVRPGCHVGPRADGRLYVPLQRRRAEDEGVHGVGSVRAGLTTSTPPGRISGRSGRTSTLSGIWRRTTSPSSITCSRTSPSGPRRSARAC